jgi:hypothetical protein
MPESNTIQAEKEYTPDEKKLCEILTNLCSGVKVCLGWGPGPEPAWFIKNPGGCIVIDKRFCSTALAYIHNHPPDFDNTILHLIEPLSHCFAHYKGGSNDHDINFYKRQTESYQVMMSNYIRRSKSRALRSISSKKFTVFRKVMWTKTPELAKQVIEEVGALMPEQNILNENETELIGRNITWSQYTKLMRIFSNLEHYNDGLIKFSRAKNL